MSSASGEPQNEEGLDMESEQMENLDEKSIEEEIEALRKSFFSIINRTRTPKVDLESLMEFIGGFKYWNKLNDDCRQEVVKYLGYTERCTLGICSKRDYETVKATPMDVFSIEIQDKKWNPQSDIPDELDYVAVLLQLGVNYHNAQSLHVSFYQIGDDTKVEWMLPNEKYKKGSVVWKSCNYYEEAVKYAEKWMKKCNFEVKQITIAMNKYPFETSIIKSLPKCEEVLILTDEVELLRWWLQKAPDQLKKIDLQPINRARGINIPSELFNAPQIMQTTRFDCRCLMNLTNEQFLNLEANWLRLDNVVITDETINKFIKRWVNGSHFDFEQAFISSRREFNFSELTRGLEVRPWDAEFAKEAADIWEEFMHTYGTCVQISNRVDPYESLTLHVHGGNLSISATGHRETSDGKDYTKYSRPLDYE